MQPMHHHIVHHHHHPTPTHHHPQPAQPSANSRMPTQATNSLPFEARCDGLIKSMEKLTEELKRYRAQRGSPAELDHALAELNKVRRRTRFLVGLYRQRYFVGRSQAQISVAEQGLYQLAQSAVTAVKGIPQDLCYSPAFREFVDSLNSL